MALKTWATDAEHPALMGFLRSHANDEQLQGITAMYKASEGRLDAHISRQTEAQTRLTEIDTLLVDAGAKERASLLSKRAVLEAELASMPATLSTLRNRRKDALI